MTSLVSLLWSSSGEPLMSLVKFTKNTKLKTVTSWLSISPAYPTSYIDVCFGTVCKIKED